MQVLRYRHDNNMKYGYPDGDLGRIKTQQALLKAMVEQLLQLKNVAKIGEFAKVFQKNVETDLTFNEMLWFGQKAVMGGLKIDNVNFVTMPNTPASCWSRTYQGYQSYVVPNAQELLALVNSDLSPFVEPSVLSDLDIMSVNSDGSVSSTTGHVEDSKAAKPPVKPVKPAETEPEEPVVDDNGNVIDPDTGEIIQTPDTEIVTPPEEGGGTTTPPEAGTVTPPAGNGGETSDPGTVTPPETTTPDTGGETEPPAEPATPEEPSVPEDPGFSVIEPPPAA